MGGIERAAVTSSMQETAQLISQALGGELDELMVSQAVAGVFFTGAVLSSGHAGMAFTPIGEMPEAVCCPRTASRMPQAGKLAGTSVRHFLPWAYDANVLKATIGVAVLNALSHYLWDRHGAQGCRIIEGSDPVERFAFTPDDKVVLVGALVPYIRMLREKGCSFSILEKTPQTLRGDELNYYVPPEGAQEALSHANAVIATGAILVNGSVDQLLDWTPDGSRVVIVGPTASMVPDALFHRGVEALGGVRITDPGSAMRIIAEGGSGYHMFGKCAQKIAIIKG